MKNRFFASIAFLGLTTLVLTSCSSVPQVEIDAANAAIEQAKSAGADVYVHENFVSLQDSLNSAMVIIEAQKSKFFSDYTTAKDYLAVVTQYAAEVQQLAEIRKEEVSVEAQNTIAEVKALVESNRQLVLEAPKGKEGAAALVAINGEIDAVEASINEANTLLETGDYIATLDKANVAKAKASAINTELTEVIAKHKTNKR